MSPFAVSSITLAPFAALLVAGLVYTAAAAGANAQTLEPDTRRTLSDMREGELRKLNLHAQARPSSGAAYFDTEGQAHRLADTNGKVRLVNFWATWCAPCRQEKPALDRLAAALGGAEFEVIAIAVGRHDLAAIKRFNEEVGVETLTTYLDPDSELAGDFGVPGLPVTVLLNREGQEIGRLMGGADWDSENAQALIAEVIALGR